MKIGNTDGLTRSQRMNTINNYSTILDSNKKVVNMEIDKIVNDVRDVILDPSARSVLAIQEDIVFPSVNKEVSVLFTKIETDSTLIVNQVKSTVTLTAGDYYTNLITESGASRDAITTTVEAEILVLETELGNTMGASEKLLKYQTAFNTPTATTVSECKTFYYEKLVKTGLLVPWATSTSINDCYTLYKNFKILEALQVANNINIIGSHINAASASATLLFDGSGYLDYVTLDYPGSGYLYLPEILFIKGGSGVDSTVIATMTKSITELKITDKGLGYSSPPTVIFTGGNGKDAKAITTIDFGGRITSITITNSGTGYTSVPTITFSGSSSRVAVAEATIGNGTIVTLVADEKGGSYVSVPEVKFVGGGIDATVAGVPTTGSSSSISAIHATYAGVGYANLADVVIVSQAEQAIGTISPSNIKDGVIYSITVDNGGANYKAATTSVNITGGDGNAAAGLVIDASGVITSITVTNGGATYTESTTVVDVVDASGQGSGAIITPVIKNKVIKEITVDGGGSGYLSAPNVYIYGKGMSATATSTLSGSSVVSFTVTNGGYGYTGTPIVIVGQGFGATATTTVLNREIKEIKVTNKGEDGYRLPSPLIISSGDGTKAEAVARVGIGNIIDVKVINGGSGYDSSTTTCTILGSLSSDFASTEVVVEKGAIKEINILDGGMNYPYPNLAMGVVAYKDYRLRSLLGYPSAIHGAAATYQHYTQLRNASFGFPDASSISEMETAWIKMYKLFLIENPNMIQMPLDEQDALYIAALAPGSASVNNAKNSYFQKRMGEILNTVNVERPLSHPRSRRDMDIVLQSGIHKTPVVKPKEDQADIEINKKPKSIAYDTRSEKIEKINNISNIKIDNLKVIKDEVKDIKFQVSFDYRYVDAKPALDDKVALIPADATDDYDDIISNNDSTIQADATAIWNEQNTKSSAYITKMLLVNTKYETLAQAIWAKVDVDVNSIVASASNDYGMYMEIATRKVNEIIRDIANIKDQVRAQIRQYNQFQPTVVVTSRPEGSGAVVEPLVLTGGIAYTIAPVTIGGNGVDGDAEAYIVDGSIASITVRDGGSGYTSAPITIGGDGIGAFANAVLKSGVITEIAIANGGYNYTHAEVTIIDGGSEAILEAVIENGFITEVKIINGGHGYKFPEIHITNLNGPGIGAQILAFQTNGVITSTSIMNAGKHYNEATITIKDGGSGATALVIVDPATKKVTGIVMQTGGSDYSSAPTITITGDGSNVRAGTVTMTDGIIDRIDVEQGTITGYTVKNGGSGYWVDTANGKLAPLITVLGVKGSGATGTPVISNGVITAVNVATRGSGYLVIQSDNDEFLNDAFTYSTNKFQQGNPYIQIMDVTKLHPFDVPDVGLTFTEPYWYYLDQINPIILPDTGSATNYLNFRTKRVLEMPDSGTSAEAVKDYTLYNIKKDLGYPNASTVSDAGGLAKVSRKKSELGFPNLVNINDAKTLYNTQYNDIDLGFPNYITTVTVTNRGQGYTSAPTISIVGGGSSGASAVCTVSGGGVNAVTLISGGASRAGYRKPVEVEFIGGGGDGVLCEAIIIGGVIVRVIIIKGGSNYNTSPTISIVGDGSKARGSATAVAGVITHITIDDGGYDYTHATIQVIDEGSGASIATQVDETTSQITGFDGSSLVAGTGYTTPPVVRFKEFKDPIPATAIANINHKGEVESITVMSKGGYYVSQPRVIFHGGGGGSGATAETNIIVADSYAESSVLYKQKQQNEALGAPAGTVLQADAKEYYRINKLSYLVDAPGSTDLATAKTIHDEKFYINTLYPGANPVLVNTLIPEVFLNKLDRELFPNDTDKTAAELLYLYTKMEELKTTGSSLTQEEIDQLYRDVFGYPTTSSIVFKGLGYIQDPTVDLVPEEDDVGFGATATPFVSNGQIAEIKLLTGGSFYDYDPRVFVRGRGTGAVASARINKLTHSVETISMLTGGTGYVGVPYVIITGGRHVLEAIATASIDAFGRITAVNIEPGFAGTGYSSPPIISFRAKVETGFISAIATASTDGDKLTGIEVTTAGFAYGEVPKVVIRRVDDATAEVKVENGEISDVYLTSAGSNYTRVPVLTIHAGEPLTIKSGRGARTELKLNDDATVSLHIPVEDAEEGYIAERTKELFEGLTISTDPLSNIPSSFTSTNMNIQSQNLTHYERVYGRKLPGTITTQNSMTLVLDRNIQTQLPIKQRIVPKNMSISQKSSVITREERSDRSSTYITLYKQAEALVKAKVIRDANGNNSSHTIIHYTLEEQKQLLYAQLAKIPTKKRPFSELSKFTITGSSFGAIVNSNKRFIQFDNLSHVDRLEYNAQRTVIQKSILDLIDEIERSWGGAITAHITNNGGINYMPPAIVSISVPDATIIQADVGAITITDGSVVTIKLTDGGSGYPTIPLITISGGGAVVDATAVALIDDTTIAEIRIISPGSGYTSEPTVEIQHTKVQATALASIEYGVIKSITVTDKGWGYINPTINIDTTNQTGTGATLSHTIEESSITDIYINDILDTLTVTDVGQRFNPDYPPSIIFSKSGSYTSAVATVPIIINQLGIPVIDSRGSRYTSAPTVSLVINPLERTALENKYMNTPSLPDESDSVDEISFSEIKKIRQIKNIFKGSELSKTTINARVDALRAYKILLANPNPVQALATPVVSDGVVQSITMDNKGSGYITGYIATISGTGVGLELKINIDTDGSISGVTVVNGGTGYFDPLTITIPVPDTKNKFKSVMDKAIELTKELKKATGINLEPPLTGAGDLKSDILKVRSTRLPE